MTIIDVADRKSRIRATIFLMMAGTLIASTWMNSDLVSERPIRIVPWLLMVALAAANLTPLATLRSPLAALLNDETTQAHRRESFVAGFWAALASASAVAIVAAFTPITAILAAKVVIAAALAAALVSFAVQELRAGR